uniref:Uncharacterized protein n=1 Tax=Rhizophora mucronata TaxID=61149 RepID=A0A2P2MXI8_RHIMU
MKNKVVYIYLLVYHFCWDTPLRHGIAK